MAFARSNVETVPWTTHLANAQEWCDLGYTVFARKILNGHSGNGIVEMNAGEPSYSTNARLYTLYKKKKHEFRLHVINGRVIDVQRKGLSQEFRGREDINWKVRNLQNGFIYARNDVDIADRAKIYAIQAVSALGLDFGAVDMIYSSEDRCYYVLEVNTAPGLSGTTLENYRQAFAAMEQGE